METVLWCDKCGKNIHEECFHQWRDTCAFKSLPVTCVFCRCLWKPGENNLDDVVPILEWGWWDKLIP